MNGKQAKALRGQLKQVVKELLPEILSEELQVSQYNALVKAMNGRLDAVGQQVQETLARIDERARSAQDFIVRQALSSLPSAQQAPIVDSEEPALTPTEDNKV